MDFAITPAILGSIFLVALYGAMAYAKQTWGPNPETWSLVKYGEIFGAAALVTVVGYLATGVLNAATIDQINQVLQPALALLGGSVMTILGYRTVKNAATAAVPAPASAAVAPVPAPAVSTIDPTRGQVDILGIYGHSAYHDQPAESLTFDVNQVPALFFNVLVRKPGRVTFGILYDGKPLHNFEEFHTDFENVLDMRPIAFATSAPQWITGTHKITIRVGHDTDPGTAWDEYVHYTLVLTGMRPLE